MKKSKFRKLIELFGVYAAASWGAIEFSQFLSNTFLWSEHISKVAFWVAASILPTIILNALIFTDDDDEILQIKHNKIRKIMYFLNSVLTIAVLVICIFAYDLSSQLTSIKSTDESGNISEQMQVKDEYIKSLAIFNFDNKRGNDADLWLSYGLPELLNISLKQDLYIKPTNELYYFTEKKGFASSLNIPLESKLSISKEANKKFFISGVVFRDERGFNANITLYETESQKAISNKAYSNKSLFKLSDEITADIRKDIGNPSGYLKNSKLLPSDMVTTQFIDAYRDYSLAGYYLKEKKDAAKAKEYYYSAINIDNQFNEAQEGLIKVFESSGASVGKSQSSNQANSNDKAYQELYEKLKKDMNASKPSSSNSYQPTAVNANTSSYETKSSQPAPVEPEKSVSKCYTLRFCPVQTEAEAVDILNRLKAVKYADDLKISTFNSADGTLFYRVTSGCFNSIQEANSEVKFARQTAKQVGITQNTIIIKN